MRCICSNYGCTQKLNQIFITTYSFCYTRCSTEASGGARPRSLAPGQRNSEETSQRWRAVGHSVSDLTGLGIEPQNFRIDNDIFNN